MGTALTIAMIAVALIGMVMAFAKRIILGAAIILVSAVALGSCSALGGNSKDSEEGDERTSIQDYLPNSEQVGDAYDGIVDGGSGFVDKFQEEIDLGSIPRPDISVDDIKGAVGHLVN